MKKQNIEFQIDQKTSDGEYSNIVNILFNDMEFIFDFARILPGTPVAKIKARVIMNPKNAKALLKLLEGRIHDYEAKFGEIKFDNSTLNTKGNIGFKVDENS